MKQAWFIAVLVMGLVAPPVLGRAADNVPVSEAVVTPQEAVSASAVAPPLVAPLPGAEAERLAIASLEYFNMVCAPLAGGSKSTGLFGGLFGGGDNPLVGKCLNDLDRFARVHRERSQSAEALWLAASLQRSRKNVAAEAAILARLRYLGVVEEWRKKAENRLLVLAAEELKGERKGIKVLAGGSPAATALERHLHLVRDLALLEGEPFPALLRDEGDRFLELYPAAPEAEAVLALREESFAREKRFELAAAGLQQLNALYPRSVERPKRLAALGTMQTEQLRQYETAEATFEQIIAGYPEAPEAQLAYQRAALLCAEQLGRYPRAIELYDRIAERYPKSEAAQKALESQARLFANKIKNVYSAIKSWQRLADMFPGDAGVAALGEAAGLARTAIEDYELQIEIQQRLVKEYPQRKEAVAALLLVGETLEEKLGRPEQAQDIYRQLIGNYEKAPEAERAKRRLDRLVAPPR